MDRTIVEKILEDAGYKIKFIKRYKNCAYRIKLTVGDAFYCGDKGDIWAEGKHKYELVELVNEKYLNKSNDKVFIAYGKDTASREDLENLLRTWNLKPLVLENLPSQGTTIIEKLEQYIPQAKYGIVLFTPDDIGYQVGDENNRKFRARQNVVLELGMLFMKLGRKHVAIIMKKDDKIEKPSDINGILYLGYKNNISEIAERLKKEINKSGYSIPLS